jgi:hypothetical protein
MEPDPSAVAPWYLRNVNQALALDETTGNVYLRTDAQIGDVTITGNVNIPGTVAATQSGNWNVGLLGNLAGITGNVNIGTMPNVNATVSGTVAVSAISSNVTVVDGGGSLTIDGNVGISGTANVSLGSSSTDAFGRLRVSNPTTLFDTQSRYYDHEQFASNIAGGGSVLYNANSSTYELNVTTGATDSVIQETYKVFPYQPGKSLLIFATFCMSSAKPNLRQRVGYFNSNNGIFFEQNGITLNMVIRSSSTGSMVEDRIPQSSWNGDNLSGTGGSSNPSGIALNTAVDQIWFTDVEWLGVGSVRVGFVINGVFYTVHTFNHANIVGNTTTYMSTACLPLRYEITNIGVTSSSSMLRQICASVISEGGYSLSGTPASIGHNLGAPIRLPNDQSFLPLLSIRLKSTMPDAIVLPKYYTIAPVGQSVFKYRIYSRAVTTGGSFTSMGANSPVEYNLAPLAVSSGTIVSQGYIVSSNQSSAAPMQVPLGFDVQLQRQPFTGVTYEYVITAATTGTNQDVYASLEWQEVS